jgi:hypothetical protein
MQEEEDEEAWLLDYLEVEAAATAHVNYSQNNINGPSKAQRCGVTNVSLLADFDCQQQQQQQQQRGKQRDEVASSSLTQVISEMALSTGTRAMSQHGIRDSPQPLSPVAQLSASASVMSAPSRSQSPVPRRPSRSLSPGLASFLPTPRWGLDANEVWCDGLMVGEGCLQIFWPQHNASSRSPSRSPMRRSATYPSNRSLSRSPLGHTQPLVSSTQSSGPGATGSFTATRKTAISNGVGEQGRDPDPPRSPKRRRDGSIVQQGPGEKDWTLVITTGPGKMVDGNSISPTSIVMPRSEIRSVKLRSSTVESSSLKGQQEKENRCPIDHNIDDAKEMWLEITLAVGCTFLFKKLTIVDTPLGELQHSKHHNSPLQDTFNSVGPRWKGKDYKEFDGSPLKSVERESGDNILLHSFVQELANEDKESGWCPQHLVTEFVLLSFRAAR